MFFLLLSISLINLITGAASPSDTGEATLIFVGDAMQHQAQLDVAKEIGKDHYDYSDCFTLISPELLDSDYAVCNLEVPLGGGPSYSGYPCFSAPDSYAEELRDAGFNLMVTANNHCLDRSDKAARRTLLALDSLGIDHTGTFHDRAQRDSLVPLIKDINGFKIGFLNYTYGTNGILPKEGTEIALIEKDKMAKEIQKTKDKGAEIIIVAMHWGIEYVLLPNKIQKELADFLVDNGVDLVIGSHPHVIQPMELKHNDKYDKDYLVVYSLGNFISNMKTADTRGGALVKVSLKRDENGKAYLNSANYDTFFVSKPYDGHNFRVIPLWSEVKLPEQQQTHRNLFERSAEKIFSTYNVNVSRLHKRN